MQERNCKDVCLDSWRPSTWKRIFLLPIKEPNAYTFRLSSICLNSQSYIMLSTNTYWASGGTLGSVSSSVQFSHSVMSDSLWPHRLQHPRPPCPSPTPGVYTKSCPLSQWCHPTISSSVVPFSSCLSIFPSIRVFSDESALRIRWPKDWSFSFSISPSNEYSELISFRVIRVKLLGLNF